MPPSLERALYNRNINNNKHNMTPEKKNNRNVKLSHCKWDTLQTGHKEGHKTGHKVTGNASPGVGSFRVNSGSLRVTSGHLGLAIGKRKKTMVLQRWPQEYMTNHWFYNVGHRTSFTKHWFGIVGHRNKLKTMVSCWLAIGICITHTHTRTQDSYRLL